MTKQDRRGAVDSHNKWRSSLARGSFLDYPQASNMSYLKYDCGLENKSLEIAVLNCNGTSEPSFDYVGSNNNTVHGRISPLGNVRINFGRVVQTWFKTAQLYNSSHSLLPSSHNVSEIPFLQAANDRTTKVGCAYYICAPETERPEGDDDSDDVFFWLVGRNVSLTCTYGEPHINVSVPIYTNGTPCEACGGQDNSSCIWKTLCNNTGA